MAGVVFGRRPFFRAAGEGRGAGKDGACALWVSPQGLGTPVDQKVDPECRSPRAPALLPLRFAIYASCAKGHRIEAECMAPNEVWTATHIFTSPVAPTQGVSGRWSCPCCACFTFDEQPTGTFAICPVCWWEDERVQFEDPLLAGGANLPSLSEARRSYLASGVADPDHGSYVRPPRDDEKE